jgi:GntR family transcriptional regulator, vanillate catabolism transcriptional regulator
VKRKKKDEAVDLAALADPQHTEPATHTVLLRLREMIVTGQIAPGSRLRAEGIADELQVSRTPVRSALAVLSAEGLVAYSMNRGYTVHAVTIRDVLDSIEVRANLESLACRICVDHGWETGDLDRLEGTVRRGREIVDRGEWSEQIEAEWYIQNFAFHRAIHQATNNHALRNSIRMTVIYPVFGDVVRVCPSVAEHVPQRARQIPATPPLHIVQSQGEHEQLLDAMNRGDIEASGRIMHEHVISTKARVHAVATLR